MNDLQTQEDLYNELKRSIIELQADYEQKKTSLKKEYKQLIDKNRELRSSLSDKTLLLAVDYEKLSAAFGVLHDDNRKEMVKLDKIKLERDRQTQEYEIDRKVYDNKISELMIDFEQKKQELQSMEDEKNHLKLNISDLQHEIKCTNKDKKMLEEEILKLKLIKEDIKGVEQDIVKFRIIKDEIIKNVEDVSKELQDKQEQLKQFALKVTAMEERERVLDEKSGLLSDKERWIDLKREKLKKVKKELEEFYERKLNHINLD